MAIISSHTLNGMNGTHAGGFPVRLINITKNSEIFSKDWKSKIDNGRYCTEDFLGSIVDCKDSYCAFDLEGDLGKPISIFEPTSSSGAFGADL